jgi:hypothetical protein
VTFDSKWCATGCGNIILSQGHSEGKTSRGKFILNVKHPKTGHSGFEKIRT